MKEYPQGLRPWAKHIPLWALLAVCRIVLVVLLPTFVLLGAWEGLKDGIREIRRPF